MPTPSNPNFIIGQIPTASQWNSYFSAKNDYGGDVSPNTVIPTGQTTALTLANILTNVTGAGGSAGGLVIYDSNGNITLVGAIAPGASGSTPTSGATIQIPNNVSTYYVRGSAMLASLTVEFPAVPIVNQTLVIIFQIGVSSLNLTAPAGYTINNPVTGQAVLAGTRIVSTLDGTLWC